MKVLKIWNKKYDQKLLKTFSDTSISFEQEGAKLFGEAL
jgi:hypothetical protein